MNPELWAIIIPAGVALAGTYFGYRQFVKTGAQRASVDERTANLAELKAVNEALTAEIQRVREDADEDRTRFRAEFEAVQAELRWMRRDRADQIRRDHTRAEFDRQMIRWVNEWLPRARTLGLEVPDPPHAPDLPELIDPFGLDTPHR